MPALRSVAVTPTLHSVLGITPPNVQPSSATYPALTPPTVLFTGGHVQIAAIAMDVINDMSRMNFQPQDQQLIGGGCRRGADQPEYIPDFAAAASEMNLLIETKRAADMQTEEVQTKARAAAVWCAHASTYAAANGSKPWRYLLIPHDVVQVNATLGALAASYRFRQVTSLAG